MVILFLDIDSRKGWFLEGIEILNFFVSSLWEMLEEACCSFYTKGVSEAATKSLFVTFSPFVGQLKNLKVFQTDDILASAQKLTLHDQTPINIPSDATGALDAFEAILKKSLKLPWTLYFVSNICLVDLIQNPAFKISVAMARKLEFRMFPMRFLHVSTIISQ